ncbi:hypothetical protein [Endozoicomonas sp. 2B-B]
MIYRQVLQLKANTPQRVDDNNFTVPRQHFLEVETGTVTIKGTLDASLTPKELGTATGPTIVEIPTPVVHLELTSDADTTVVVCGA